MKPPTDTPARVRLTIAVTPEVHETFKRMAEAGGMSISRAMGDWLDDTLDAAQHIANMMEKARKAPRIVAQEMHAYALGLADETSAVLQKVRSGSRAAQAAAGADGSAARLFPPSGNTGGKVPTGKRKAGGANK